MQKTIKKLPKGEAEITIIVEPDEMRPHLEQAARELTEEKPLDGFRPGKAPYDAVKQHYGEMAIYETAATPIVRKTYFQVVREENLNVYGEPHIKIKKLAPGNAFEFEAQVALVPTLSHLPELKNIRVKSKKPVIADKEIDLALKELQKMRTKEVLVDRAVQSGDKVVVDIDMLLAGVPLEGGQARNHAIYLEEDYYIPGMKEQLAGLKAADKKEFPLKFPETHYQKNIAGKDVDFKVTVKSVFELQHPELDDEFAKGLGQKSFADLRAIIIKNMENEAQEKESRRAENEAVEKIVEKTRFDDIPDIIINQEIDRMLQELAHDLNERGVVFEDYLKNINKKLLDLKLDFTPQAIKRVKAALALREIGLNEKLEADDKEVLDEQQRLINAYSEDAETQAKVRDEEFLDYIRATLRNRKVTKLIRETCIEAE